jgi:hypothetical protein
MIKPRHNKTSPLTQLQGSFLSKLLSLFRRGDSKFAKLSGGACPVNNKPARRAAR